MVETQGKRITLVTYEQNTNHKENIDRAHFNFLY